ncbi:MAG TPA: 6-phosphogluconolactonase [Dermatophilaceae bacterium]|nr:6-phosphogluconolactonase [Dermatophilaceae bacterium]
MTAVTGAGWLPGPPRGHRLRRAATKAELATAAASRLTDQLTEILYRRKTATIALTGGSMGEAVMRALSAHPGAVDWSRVGLWWSDERFLPAGHPDRNDTQARDAGLGRLGLDPTRVHRLPQPDECADDVHLAAESYAKDLRAAAAPGRQLPAVDVLMLGVGPDGHVASLFPGHPALAVTDLVCVGIEDSPKPPPRRVTWTLPALCQADRVWFLVSGADKADAVRRALDGPAGTRPIPAGAVTGRRSTTWWVDAAAAPPAQPTGRS